MEQFVGLNGYDLLISRCRCEVFDQRCKAQDKPEHQPTLKITRHVSPGKVKGLLPVKNGRFFAKDLRVEPARGIKMCKVEMIGRADQNEIKRTWLHNQLQIIEDPRIGDLEITGDFLEQMCRGISDKGDLDINTFGDVPDDGLHSLSTSDDAKSHAPLLFSLAIFFNNMFRFVTDR